MEPLILSGTNNRILFCDERDRAPLQTPVGAVTSVTLESDDTSWGEFLDLSDLALLHAWSGQLLAQALTQEEA